MSYARLIESLMRHGPPGDSRHAISWKWAADTVEHPDFDIPGVLVNVPTVQELGAIAGQLSSAERRLQAWRRTSRRAMNGVA